MLNRLVFTPAETFVYVKFGFVRLPLEVADSVSTISLYGTPKVCPHHLLFVREFML